MKLIATRDFYNNCGIAGVRFDEDAGKHVGGVEGAPHPLHVHKGAKFDIGTTSEFKNLTGPEKKLVAELVHANCIGDATDKKVCARVAAEIAAEKKREEAQLKAAKEAAGGSAVVALTELFQKMQAVSAPAAGK